MFYALVVGAIALVVLVLGVLSFLGTAPSDDD